MNKNFSKKGQGWGIDLIAAITIFLVGIIIFYFYSLNYPTEGRETFETLNYGGDLIMDSLLSSGYPEDWNSENVIKIGIVDSGKINQTKLDRFYNLVNSNYNKTKNMFNVQSDYFLIFESGMKVEGESVNGVGKPGTDPANITVDNLIKITRLSIYEEKPVTAYLYIWKNND